MTQPQTYYGVYRVAPGGKHVYVGRSCTTNEKLARELAADLTAGQFVRPDGSMGYCRARPHIVKPIVGPKPLL